MKRQYYLQTLDTVIPPSTIGLHVVLFRLRVDTFVCQCKHAMAHLFKKPLMSWFEAIQSACQAYIFHLGVGCRRLELE